MMMSDDDKQRQEDAGDPKCPGCGHPASAHDHWPNEDPGCFTCVEADDESDCGYAAEVIIWLAAGRPICRACLHPDFAHTAEKDGGSHTCKYVVSDFDGDMGACGCIIDGEGVIAVDRHAGEKCAAASKSPGKKYSGGGR